MARHAFRYQQILTPVLWNRWEIASEGTASAMRDVKSKLLRGEYGVDLEALVAYDRRNGRHVLLVKMRKRPEPTGLEMTEEEYLALAGPEPETFDDLCRAYGLDSDDVRHRLSAEGLPQGHADTAGGRGADGYGNLLPSSGD